MHFAFRVGKFQIPVRAACPTITQVIKNHHKNGNSFLLKSQKKEGN
jgi:hypothetical protein